LLKHDGGSDVTRIAFAMAVALATMATPAVATRAAADAVNPGGSLEIAIKATFLYKFAPFVVWPPTAFASPTSAFALCVVGDDPFGPMLDRVVSGQHYDGHDIKVVHLGTLTAESGCNLAFIATRDPRLMTQSLEAVSASPVLTVTDSMADDSAKGMINFRIANDHVAFEIDAARAARSGLSISSKLLSLAVAVKASP
jgi:hypothetical protein